MIHIFNFFASAKVVGRRWRNTLIAVIFLAGIYLEGCSGSARPLIVVQGPGILVVNSDYGTTGSYSYYPSSGAPVIPDIATIGSDAVAGFAGNRLAIINRYGQDNILFLQRDLLPGLQFSVGAGSNPYDIAEIDGERALVSRWASASLWVVNTGSGARVAEIDLSGSADADGIPEMAYMTRAGNPRRILVALQRLTNFAPSDFSSYAIINPFNLTVETVRHFTLKNPVTRWVSDGSHYYIGLVGSYGTADGGIVRVNGTTLLEDGVVLSETVLNEDIGPFTIAGGKFFVITSALTCGQPPWTPCTTSLYEFVPPGPPVLLTTAPGFHYSAVAVLPGTPYVALADRNPGAPGIWFYDTRAKAFSTSAPIPVSQLPPADMVSVY
ncbi:MAG: hypothetical protein V2G42_05990 [bacterium JZ-2024 1]